MTSKLFIYDGNSVAAGEYYAVPPLTSANGTPTNAVYGFIRSFFSLMDLDVTHLAVTFDSATGYIKKQQHPTYKAQRTGMGEDYYVQLPIIKDFLDVIGVAHFQLEGYESDDIIACIVRDIEAGNTQITPTIITRDKDLLALCSLITAVRLIRRTGYEDYTVPDVLERMGVRADQVQYLKALMGDPSDNIKGVPGVGKIAATKMLTKYADLEMIKTAATMNELEPKRFNKIINENLEALYSSYNQVKFMYEGIDLNLSESMSELQRKPMNEAALKEFFLKYNMNSLI